MDSIVCCFIISLKLFSKLYSNFVDTPAFHTGIKVGDIILKVNGTCVRSKDPTEINNLIYESKLRMHLAFGNLFKERGLQ